MKKILLSLFLVMILSFTPVYESYADAGTITIAGGSIGVAGLGAAGLAGLTGPVVVAVFFGLMAFGLNVELTKQSEAAGMTKTEFVKTKIQQYCNEANITLGVFNDAILSGMTVLNDGRISLTDQACKQIKQFGNWLFENDDVLDTTQTPSSDAVEFDGKNFPLAGNITINEYANGVKRANYIIQFSQAVAIANIENLYYRWVFFSKNSFTCQRSTGGSYHNVNVSQLNGYYYVVFSGFNDYTYDTTVSGIPMISQSAQDFINGLDGTWNPSSGEVSNNTFTGSKDDWAAGNNVLDPTADKTTVINPNITIPTTSDKDLTIDVNSYLEALQKVLDKLQDITIPAVDDATGVPVDITIEIPQVIDLDITKEDDTELPDEDEQTPVINDEDTPVGPAAVEPLKFDLRNIFPFCIPFDVRDMISMLSAEPEAPRYHVSWEIPWINENLEFTIDLSEFDSVAAICRKMELLLFVVGLAVVTRSMFIRS